LSIVLVFLALLMGAVVWWLVKQTINVQPWVAHPATDSVRDEGVRSPITSKPLSNIKIGLGVFLAVATSLFALFISAYSIRMEYPDWRPLTEPALLWTNTAILVLSSVFLQWGWVGAKRGNLQTVWLGVGIGGAFSIAFIFGQWTAWEQLASAGFFAIGNPAIGFFYVLTGAHALHLIGGLVALSRTVSRLWRGQDMESIKVGVELCAVYWHYLLVVWLILFGLLLTT
jgi:cytochrome c oxidase subunit 3